MLIICFALRCVVSDAGGNKDRRKLGRTDRHRGQSHVGICEHGNFHQCDHSFISFRVSGYRVGLSLITVQFGESCLGRARFTRTSWARPTSARCQFGAQHFVAYSSLAFNSLTGFTSLARFLHMLTNSAQHRWWRIAGNSIHHGPSLPNITWINSTSRSSLSHSTIIVDCIGHGRRAAWYISCTLRLASCYNKSCVHVHIGDKCF